MMKKLLLFLMLLPLLFAADAYAWQGIAIIALFVAATILIIFFLLSYAVDSREMRAMVAGELFQVFIGLVIIASFVGIEGFADEVIGPGLADYFGAPPDTTHIEYAILVTNSTSNYLWDYAKVFSHNTVMPLGALSSISSNCIFLGLALTYNGCASMAVPFSSATLALRVLTTAILMLNSQLVLLSLANSFFFPVLLPVGLFLRCFHFTRGAGGLLIAIAVAFYFIYPFAVLLTKGMADSVVDEYTGEPIYGDPDPPYFEAPEVFSASFDIPGDCNPVSYKSGFGGGYGATFEYTKDAIKEVMNDDLINSLLFQFMVAGLFTALLNVLIAISAVGALARLFGAEVDVSALARIA